MAWELGNSGIEDESMDPALEYLMLTQVLLLPVYDFGQVNWLFCTSVLTSVEWK